MIREKEASGVGYVLTASILYSSKAGCHLHHAPGIAHRASQQTNVFLSFFLFYLSSPQGRSGTELPVHAPNLSSLVLWQNLPPKPAVGKGIIVAHYAQPGLPFLLPRGCQGTTAYCTRAYPASGDGCGNDRMTNQAGSCTCRSSANRCLRLRKLESTWCISL